MYEHVWDVRQGVLRRRGCRSPWRPPTPPTGHRLRTSWALLSWAIESFLTAKCSIFNVLSRGNHYVAIQSRIDKNQRSEHKSSEKTWKTHRPATVRIRLWPCCVDLWNIFKHENVGFPMCFHVVIFAWRYRCESSSGDGWNLKPGKILIKIQNFF